jgi:predicted nucleotidyltransferase
MTEYRNIKIPQHLYEKLARMAAESGFDATEDLILFVLQDYLDQNVVKEDMDLAPEEEEQIRKRLKDLGYM